VVFTPVKPKARLRRECKGAEPFTEAMGFEKIKSYLWFALRLTKREVP
jgi:hypothetical protein